MANAIVAGWGNQYFFCNERNVLSQLDEKINSLIREFFRKYLSVAEDMQPLARRRMIGVKSLHDCKIDPIVWRVATKTTKVTADDFI